MVQLPQKEGVGPGEETLTFQDIEIMAKVRGCDNNQVSLQMIRMMLDGDYSATLNAFLWRSTTQGPEYWQNIYHGTPLTDGDKIWLRKLYLYTAFFRS